MRVIIAIGVLNISREEVGFPRNRMRDAPSLVGGTNTDHMLEEVGQQFSVTRERIRQIEAKALRKASTEQEAKKLFG
jgi:DNA-directed RNA polymerase sigma subunit (sigma70/sigma32)